MSGQTSLCSNERLNSLLYADETSAEYEVALHHIEQCLACRERLEQMAASRDMWHDSQQALSGDKWDSQLLESTSDTAWHRLQPGHASRPETKSRHSDSTQAELDWPESLAKQLLEPASHPEMLGRLGRYEIERLIGSGGMGVVFKAFDTDLNRPVAIKVLAPHLAGIGAARQRFAREARAAAAVVHEHIVAIHNVESNDASPFLVMQYVAGESLQQRLDRCGPLQLSEILRIAMQTAAGLAAAHAQGLVHRDIKPANILLEQSVERALLTDFGLARTSDDASLTHTGYHLGTPQYMSPEQASGDPIDARSDLFSLGSVIYAMCTGRPPFRAETTLGVLRRISDHEARPMREVNADIPEWLERLVRRMHAKDPQSRFSSAEQVSSLLQQCLAHVQQPTVASLPDELSVEASQVPARSVAWRGVLFAAFALLTLIVCTVVWTQLQPANPTLPTQPAAEELRWDGDEDELQQVNEEIDAMSSSFWSDRF
jgi:serine/threonine protein kinase